MKKQKRKTWQAMRAWSQSNVVSGFVPVEWYSPRSPRSPRNAGSALPALIGGEIGALEGFRAVCL